jgi:hypothetical protein
VILQYMYKIYIDQYRNLFPSLYHYFVLFIDFEFYLAAYRLVTLLKIVMLMHVYIYVFII